MWSILERAKSKQTNWHNDRQKSFINLNGNKQAENFKSNYFLSFAYWKKPRLFSCAPLAVRRFVCVWFAGLTLIFTAHVKKIALHFRRMNCQIALWSSVWWLLQLLFLISPILNDFKQLKIHVKPTALLEYKRRLNNENSNVRLQLSMCATYSEAKNLNLYTSMWFSIYVISWTWFIIMSFRRSPELSCNDVNRSPRCRSVFMSYKKTIWVARI